VNKETADAGVLKSAMISAADAIIAAEPELTRIDSVIGDGDHGIGMKTGFSALKKELLAGRYETPYDLFHACGLCLVKSMGGSSGVLFGTLLIGGLDEIHGKDSLDSKGLCALFSGGIEAVMRRGKAKPGDKTMVDALVPARACMQEAASGGCSIEELFRAAEAGALNGVEATKRMLPRLGRSKNFREQALGWPDPGAISVSILFRGLADGIAAIAF